jgi:N4-(beta-N-acetylglucosaminyl)-L-asparaginase
MSTLDRKTFLASGAASAALGSLAAAPAGAASGRPVFLSTWDHGKPANEEGARIFAAGGSLLDAIEKGINVPENDPEITSVGYGGLPNSEGVVELDAGIMDGTKRRAGAVFSLRMVKNPISVARLVMEKTHHTQIAGEGALAFAVKMGFEPMQLLTPKSLEAWLQWKNTPNHQTWWLNKDNHDTIGMLGADGNGHIAAGCSTSGMAWKIPGRVADSPLVGCGYYADDSSGAASATGDGDVMSNYCTSMFIVMKMSEGLHPQEACEASLRHMARTAPQVHDNQYCVIALNPKGEFGAASMNAKFPLTYALWRDGSSTLHQAAAVFP